MLRAGRGNDPSRRIRVTDRHFLFLQGPHGPFFHQLAQALQVAGQRTCRIGFNRGDRFFWPERDSYVPFTAPPADWPGFLDATLSARGITDIVLYGDTRRHHADAVSAARARGLRLHCFEEGYLRPYWITYERGGTNGNSALMDFSLADICARVGEESEPADAPAQWGAMWRHVLLGSLYHANILFRNRAYPHYRSHRAESVGREWRLHCKRLALYLPHALQWRRMTRALMATGRPYHVALLQLGHDASVQHHSDLGSMEAFIRLTASGFARGAARHHQLVFKAHPLEDGRENLPRIMADAARREGIAGRTWFMRGGRLGPLLDRAESAVTVNSTAGQQALWRGLPLKTFGRAVYVKPEFVSDQPLPDFFAAPKPPDAAAYRMYRQFLLETSQVVGGFYTAAGRRDACRRLVDMMLRDADPYEVATKDTIAPKIALVAERGLTG